MKLIRLPIPASARMGGFIVADHIFSAKWAVDGYDTGYYRVELHIRGWDSPLELRDQFVNEQYVGPLWESIVKAVESA